MTYGIRNQQKRPNAFANAPLPFKIMFILVSVFIAIVGVVAVSFAINLLANGGGYSYEVHYQIGDYEYHESSNYGG